MTYDNKVYNVFLDKNGEEQRRYVGDIRDVRSFKVKDLGGISVERLQRASKGRFDGTVTAFPDDKYAIPLPPNTPLYKNKVCRECLAHVHIPSQRPILRRFFRAD